MIKLPAVKSAFCGCTLEDGCKIISYVHTAVYAVLLITTAISSFTYEHDPKEDAEDDLFSLNSTNKTTEENKTDMYFMERKLIEEGFLSLSSSYFNEMVFLIQVVFSVSLLIGVHRKNLDLIFSWVILQVTNVVFSQTLVTIYFIAFFNSGPYSYTMFYLLFEEITMGIIEGYCVIVVNSHLSELTLVNNDVNDEALSPIVINSSSVDLRYAEDTNNYVH